MPRLMKTVYAQILAHPEYKTKLCDNTRLCFESGCVRGGSWCIKANNKWSREIWTYLYKNEDPLKQFTHSSKCQSTASVTNQPKL